SHTMTDKYFIRLGGNDLALNKTLDDTELLPKTASIDLGGQLASDDPKIVARAMQFVSSLKPKNLVKVEGADQLREAAHVYEIGISTRKSADQIAREYVEDREERRKDPVRYAKRKDDAAKQIDGIVTSDFVQ